MNSAENEDIMKQLHTFNWIFFSSVNGVECFFRFVTEQMEELKNVRFAAVGSKTAEALEQFGHRADFVPSVFDGRTLVKEFLALDNEIGHVLLIQGNRSRKEISDGLTEAVIPYQKLVVYETKDNDKNRTTLNEVLRTTKLDFITFTSPSSVEAFNRMKTGNINVSHDTTFVCIGRTTEDQAKELGFTNTIIPQDYTVDGMVTIMCQITNGERN